MSNPSTRKLRIGLLVDSLDQPAWVWHMLKRIADSDYAEIALVVQNIAEPPARDSRISRLWRNRGVMLFRLFQKFESRWVSVAHDAFAPTAIDDLLGDIPVVGVAPRQTKFSDYVEPADIEKLCTHSIDIFIRLGFRILRGEILRVARYGVWSFHHGDNRVNRGSPPAVWEVLEHSPVMGSILQILSEDLDNGKVLARSWSAVNGIWPKRNRDALYWRSLAMLPRQLHALHRDGEQQFFARVTNENDAPVFYSHRLYVEPTNGEFAWRMARVGLRYAQARAKELLHRGQWGLCFYLGKDFPAALWKFKTIRPPKDRFWADPFVIRRGEKYYVYFEELPFATEKGHISLLQIDAKGHCSEPVKILDLPYHLSYPCLFEWGGDLFMMPEMSANKSIDVYRCKEFPHDWEFHSTLISGVSAVDATLFEHGAKWWMSVGVREYPGAISGEDLYLFYAETPLSTAWTPHPMNPVIRDVRCARPAGNLFRHGGAIYRPSQDCSVRYGGATNIQRVTKLDEYDYAEEPVSRIDPAWARDLLGTHTLNRAENFIVIDAEIRLRRF